MEVHNPQAQLHEDGSLTISGSVHTNPAVAAGLAFADASTETREGEIRFKVHLQAAKTPAAAAAKDEKATAKKK